MPSHGPSSVKKPAREEQPGPPFSLQHTQRERANVVRRGWDRAHQSTTGSLAGSFCDSTNLHRTQREAHTE